MKRAISLFLFFLLFDWFVPNYAPETPFSGTPYPIPGRIQVEDYDNGGEGVAYHDVDNQNQGGVYRMTDGVDIETCSEGGYYVGRVKAGEWLMYSVNVTYAGTFDFSLRVSSNADGGKIHLEMDGVDVTGHIAIPNSGGSQNWTTITRSGIYWKAGNHVLRLVMDANSPYGYVGNFNYFEIEPARMQLLPSINIFNLDASDPTVFHGTFQGFGAEWDPFFWNTFNQTQGLTEADWKIITNRIKEMQIPWVRMWIQLSWALRSADLAQWDFSNARMESVFKYLAFACQNNIYVDLQDWGWSFWGSYGPFNADSSDPRFAQGLVIMLKELIVNRGYNCIKYFSLGNEPDYEFIGQGRPAKTMNDYITMIQNVDQAMKDAGIRNKVIFLGPDVACCQGLFVNTLQSPLHMVFDSYDFHHYSVTSVIANGGVWQATNQYRDWVQQYSSDPNDSGKMILVTEAGDADNSLGDSYTKALDMADYGTTILSTTIQGASAWIMHDIFIDVASKELDDNRFMGPGMWKYKDQNWALRPWAQTWGLLTRFAPRGSVQAIINGTPPQTLPAGSIRVGAVKRPDGGWSIFLVNRATSPNTIQVNFPHAMGDRLDKYLVDNTTLNGYPNNIIPPIVETVNVNGPLLVSLPAQSFTVLVEEVSK